MTSTTSTDLAELDSPSDVLVFARESPGRSEPRAGRPDDRGGHLGRAAPTGVDRRGLDLDRGRRRHRPPAGGRGAPLVAEFCIAEFALAIGRSTDAGRAVIAAAVELKYRLPRLWDRVQAGDLEAWRARRIAEATLGLVPGGGGVRGRPGGAVRAPDRDRRTRAAGRRGDRPVHARPSRRRRRNAADGRHFTIEHQQVSFDGTSQIHGELDLADALDLDAALAQGAETLQAGGSTDSLDVRRSIAAGQIARNQLALDLTTAHQPARRDTRPSRPRRSRGRWCCTCTSPRPPSPAPVTVWSWRGWRTSARASPPTRSAPGAPTPTPR